MRVIAFIVPALLVLGVLYLIHVALTAGLRKKNRELRKQRDASNELLDEVLEVAHRNREIDPVTAPVIIDEINPKRRELNK